MHPEDIASLRTLAKLFIAGLIVTVILIIGANLIG